MRSPDLKLHCDCAGLDHPKQAGWAGSQRERHFNTCLKSLYSGACSHMTPCTLPLHQNATRLLAAGVGGLGGAGGGDSMLLRLSGRVSGIMEELSETMAMLQDWSPAGGTSAVPAWRATCVCVLSAVPGNTGEVFHDSAVLALFLSAASVNETESQVIT